MWQLYLMHFPVAFVPGCSEAVSAEMMDDVPIEATWTAMEELVSEGLVRNIGVSNFEIEDLKKVQSVAKRSPRDGSPHSSNPWATPPYPSQVQKVATLPIAVNQIETHPY